MQTIDIFQLWQQFKAANNISQNGHVKPQAQFQEWCNVISLELFTEYFKKFQTSQVVTDHLSPFLVTVNVKTVEQPGRAFDLMPLPSDYAYFASARIMRNGKTCAPCQDKEWLCDNGTCKSFEDPDYKELAEKSRGLDLVEKQVGWVDNQRWGSALDHALLPPTLDRPLITQYQGGFRVAPRQIGIVVLDYFKYPRKAIFAYTLDVNDNIVYNPNGSQFPEWSTTMTNEFLSRLKMRYASFTENDGKYQQAQMEKNS